MMTFSRRVVLLVGFWAALGALGASGAGCDRVKNRFKNDASADRETAAMTRINAALSKIKKDTNVRVYGPDIQSDASMVAQEERERGDGEMSESNGLALRDSFTEFRKQMQEIPKRNLGDAAVHKLREHMTDFWKMDKSRESPPPGQPATTP